MTFNLTQKDEAQMVLDDNGFTLNRISHLQDSSHYEFKRSNGDISIIVAGRKGTVDNVWSSCVSTLKQLKGINQ